MNRNELIKFCKYYKGEGICPFKTSPKFYVWHTEKAWVEEMTKNDVVSDVFSKMLNHYMNSGFLSFEISDGTPMSLKAALLNLAEKWNEGVIDKDSFAKVYLKWKKHQI